MGNRLVANVKAKWGSAPKGKASTSTFTHSQAGSITDEDALAAELRAAQDNTLKLVAGVDLLADELRLEQLLAALDNECIGDDENPPDSKEGGDIDIDLDPEELSALEDELQELEREVLGDAADGRSVDVAEADGEDAPLEEAGEGPEAECTACPVDNVNAAVTVEGTATVVAQSTPANTPTTVTVTIVTLKPSGSNPDAAKEDAPKPHVGATRPPADQQFEGEGKQNRSGPEAAETNKDSDEPAAMAHYG